MVEINNQRKGVPRYYAGVVGGNWITGQENQKSWLWRHCRRRAIYWLIWSPSQTCHAKPKLNQQAPDATSFFPVGGMPTASSLAWKTSLRKSGRCGIAADWRSVALYLWLIVVISVRQSTVAAISGLHCRALVMVSSSIRLTAWLQIQRSGRNGQRDWCMSRVTAIIPALVICTIVRLSWAVNHYRDNAITYKAQRDKNARELEAGERGNYWHADASAYCCCARCKIHEGVSWMLKSKMMPGAWWCCRWSSSVAHQSSPSVSAWSHHRLRRGCCCQCSLPRLADTAERGLFHPQREADQYAKTTGRNPEAY